MTTEIETKGLRLAELTQRIAIFVGHVNEVAPTLDEWLELVAWAKGAVQAPQSVVKVWDAIADGVPLIKAVAAAEIATSHKSAPRPPAPRGGGS